MNIIACGTASYAGVTGEYMLEEYTFLKRPFIINGERVFIGNAKKVVEAAVESFNA